MSNIWVTSDTHFNHSNILTFTDDNGNPIRPGFSSVKEMDECLIENWNSVVKPGDKIYHLGDVVMGNEPMQWMDTFWPKLNGSKRLIVGNHDNIKKLVAGNYFAKVSMWRLFTEFGLLLTHVPVHQSNIKLYIAEGDYEEGDCGSKQVSFLNVHGHIHQNASPQGPYKCVCVEQTAFTPVNIEDLRIL